MSKTHTRRALLRGARALGVAGLAPTFTLGCGEDDAHEHPDQTLPLGFHHGVASGDPLPDGIILWTRLSGVKDSVSVTWEIATTPDFATLTQAGMAAASDERHHTVKVDVRGLAPGTTYFYRFRALEKTSPIGRTRTAPVAPVARARFAVGSCSSLSQGYFHAYRAIAARADLDAVIHLGDYLYEYGTNQFGSVRPCEPSHEIVTLADYRTRHAQYKRDPDLQEAHRQHPFITVWDDHESANNAWKDGAQNHQSNEGDWGARKAAAQRAYAEWMPIREQEGGRIWRKLAWGDLVDLVMLDTRLWGRTASLPGLAGPAPAEVPGVTLLGDDQAAWLEEQITGSTARWKVLAQQVMVANLILMPGTVVNYDQWHGYPASRRRLLEFLRMRAAGDVVVLTGDIHSSWANELVFDPADRAAYDPDAGKNALAVEFVTPGITSPGLPPSFNQTVENARPHNPHLRWFDLVRQGYLVVDVTPARTQAAWFLFANVQGPIAGEAFAAAWSVAIGNTRLAQDAEAAPAVAPAPPLAP